MPGRSTLGSSFIPALADAAPLRPRPPCQSSYGPMNAENPAGRRGSPKPFSQIAAASGDSTHDSAWAGDRVAVPVGSSWFCGVAEESPDWPLGIGGNVRPSHEVVA